MRHESVLLLCVTVLIILCVGEPDLLDALINNLNCKK